MLSSYLALWAGFEPSTTYLGTNDQLHNSARANIALNCYSSFSASSQSFFIVSIPFHSFFLSFFLSFLLANFFHHSFLTYYDSVFGFLHFLFLSLPASMLTLPFPDLETRNCSLLYVAPLKVGGCEGRKEGGMHKHTVALCKRCRPFSFEGQRREAWQSKVAFHIHSVTRAHRLKTLFLFYFFFSLSLSSDADTQTHLLWKSNLVHNHLHHGAL